MPSIQEQLAILNPEDIVAFGQDYIAQNEALGHTYQDWPREFLKHYVLHIMREFPLASRKVLDVGCAYGREVLAFIRWGHADAYGIDVCKPMIEGSPWAKELKSRIRHGWAHETGYMDNYFDLVHSQQTFEHLNPGNVRATEREIWRVLRPGGFLYATLDVVDASGAVEGRGRKAEAEEDLTHSSMMSMMWWKGIFERWINCPKIETRMAYWPEEDRRASVMVFRKPS